MIMLIQKGEDNSMQEIEPLTKHEKSELLYLQESKYILSCVVIPDVR